MLSRRKIKLIRECGKPGSLFCLSLCLVTVFTLGSKVEGDESCLGLDASQKGQG